MTRNYEDRHGARLVINTDCYQTAINRVLQGQRLDPSKPPLTWLTQPYDHPLPDLPPIPWLVNVPWVDLAARDVPFLTLLCEISPFAAAEAYALDFSVAFDPTIVVPLAGQEDEEI